MKRTIKRTEITIETVEITTIRQARGEPMAADSEHQTAETNLMVSEPTGAIELISQLEIEEKQIP
jgi:hypothetical protein